MDYLDVSFKLIRDTIAYTSLPLTHIINTSFQSEIFPDAMKLAKVIPLFKAGDKGSFSNYRPVSLLPQFSKIIEKLFNKRLDTFLEANQPITSSQNGFRNKASTSHALLDLHEQLTKSMDEKLLGFLLI